MNPLSLVVNAAIDMFVNVGKYQNMQHSWIQKLRMSVSLVAYEPLSQSFIPSPFVLSDCLICEIWVLSQHVSVFQVPTDTTYYWFWFSCFGNNEGSQS